VALARRNPLQENRDPTRINQNIRITPIRVVSEEGEQLGIIPTEQALERARDAGLDLVEVAPNERPPVCRIMDYGKFKYEKNKKKNSGHAHTKTKEIRLRPKTGQEDIRTKIRQAEKFLLHKDKVQVSVQFRGREMAHIDEGRKVMQMVIETLSEFGKVDTPPSQQGRRITCMISPK
jgi:translation initiation factor IF-3